MIKAFARHSFQFLAMLIVAIPLAWFAMWLSQKNPDSLSFSVDFVWLIGTLLRISLYFIVIDWLYASKVTASLKETEECHLAFSDMIDGFERCGAELSEEDEEALEVLHIDLANNSARRESLLAAQAFRPTLWRGACLVELVLQTCFFLVLR